MNIIYVGINIMDIYASVAKLHQWLINSYPAFDIFAQCQCVMYNSAATDYMDVIY